MIPRFYVRAATPARRLSPPRPRAFTRPLLAPSVTNDGDSDAAPGRRPESTVTRHPGRHQLRHSSSPCAGEGRPPTSGWRDHGAGRRLRLPRVNDLDAIIDRSGGLIATHELYDLGHDRGSVARLVRRREILRVRQGWFCRPGTDVMLRRAARVGGRATCRTALGLAGIWTTRDRRIHVAVPAHAVRLRTARSPLRRRSHHGDQDVVVHWRDATGSSRLLLDPLEALRDLAVCGEADEIAAAADSLLRTGRATRADLTRAADALPSWAAHAVLEADGVCESGIETIVWRLLRRHRIPARRQPRIPGVGRVDFLIAGTLIVEVDGEQYHAGAVEFERDRHRDALAAALGFRTLRFSYAQVTARPAEVEAAIRAAATRDERRATRDE
jgi:very-short-patch-repair endonuclease